MFGRFCEIGFEDLAINTFAESTKYGLMFSATCLVTPLNKYLWLDCLLHNPIIATVTPALLFALFVHLKIGTQNIFQYLLAKYVSITKKLVHLGKLN